MTWLGVQSLRLSRLTRCQRVREVFEFYSEQLGIDFTEIEGPGADIRVVVGDMWPTGVASRPGGEGGRASVTAGLAVMDGAETWDNSFGGGFFGVTLHEVGHLLGLGTHSTLPPGHDDGFVCRCDYRRHHRV